MGPEAKFKLPKRKLFGNLDPNFISHRREGLHDFIQKILKDAAIINDPDVKLFLNIDDKILQGDDNDDDNDNQIEKEEVKDENMAANLGPSEKKNVRPSDFEFL